MNEMNAPREPKIVEYGPYKLIGVGRICRSSEDCHNTWADQTGFAARAKEVEAQAGEIPYYALCRCVAGAEPGAFEYIAAMPVADGTPVPDGMAEFSIPARTYAEFHVPSLADIGRVWGYTNEWLTAHTEWKGFCDGKPEGCGCVANPSFELYPPGFNGNSELFIYIPIQQADK